MHHPNLTLPTLSGFKRIRCGTFLAQQMAALTMERKEWAALVLQCTVTVPNDNLFRIPLHSDPLKIQIYFVLRVCPPVPYTRGKHAGLPRHCNNPSNGNFIVAIN